jgi:site-specific recombinase XerD
MSPSTSSIWARSQRSGQPNPLAKPSIKQQLAAIRMLFHYLVIGQVVPFNPAASVRGPKYVLKAGKTPVLAQAEARPLFDAIDHKTDEHGRRVKKTPSEMTIAELRDRALIGVMVYSFARIGGDRYNSPRKNYGPRGQIQGDCLDLRAKANQHVQRCSRFRAR